MELKQKCFEVRKQLKMAQKEFAVIIGTNQTEVSFIERGFIPENKNKVKIIEYLYELNCVNSSNACVYKEK